jgi:hypothetical protein
MAYMEEADIRKNFEFFYFGRGRHALPKYEVMDRPLKVLEELGGQESLSLSERGSDEFPNLSREFGFYFKVFKFKGHKVKAIVTREIYPDSNEPKNDGGYCTTRIRLGNYDLEKDEEFSRLLARRLSELPSSD